MKKFNRNRFLLSRNHPSDPAEDQTGLEAWFRSVYGGYLHAAEQQSLDDHISATAGYRAMVLKTLNTDIQIDAAPQMHKFTLAPFISGKVAALVEMDALPLPADVVDIAVLHHILDFSDYPHEALKESARVVQASGQLVIVGFNPWSLFGLWRLVGRYFLSNPIWSCRCLSVGRITDWLRFVGLEPEKVTYGAFRPPIQTAGVLRRMGFVDRFMARCHLPFGNYYVLTARKIRLRPIRGRQEWLAKAMKPVKLAPGAQFEKKGKR